MRLINCDESPYSIFDNMIRFNYLLMNDEKTKTLI